ncbi:hypothetical protein B7494_g7493 [Chlorociboria aeruginascens]|nr:hypothetical protein B7494_g7493 [Chlorociboria aeruginascens]
MCLGVLWTTDKTRREVKEPHCLHKASSESAVAGAATSLLPYKCTMENWTYSPALQSQREALLREVSEVGKVMLADGAKAVDVVEFVVAELENHDDFNAGKGGAVNEAGGHELEAAIVDGSTGSYGAVACVENVKNPIKAARSVLECDSLCFLVGDSADRFARERGLDMVDNKHFTTAKRLEHLKSWKAGELVQAENLGTVGAIALDVYGNLAAGGSTGGNTCKPLGRIGDTAIIGAGLIADSNVAVACSGHGEAILQANVSATVCHHVAAGIPLKNAIELAIKKVSNLSDGMPCAILAMDHRGRVSSQSTGRIFSTATSSSHAPTRAHMLQTEVAILDQHIVYQDGQLCAGLTRYPSMPGQVTIELRNDVKICDLSLNGMTQLFTSISKILNVMKSATGTSVCGLVTDGGSKATLITYSPRKTNSSVSANQRPTHEKIFELPSSLKATDLVDHSELSLSSNSIDATILWEDEFYAAFVSPSCNIPGECILRPKASTDFVSASPDFEARGLQDLARPVHATIALLKSTLKVKQFRIIMDDSALGTGNLRLIPQLAMDLTIPIPIPTWPIYQAKEGDIAFGNSDANLFSIANVASAKSWEDASTHCLKALRDPWYKAMFVLQDSFYHTCVKFFQTEMSYDYVLSPVTSDCISSPMGLGSDSLPVQIPLYGRNTYLADSMQFTLEYMLRVKDESNGMYYISPSFRGENPDTSHLNQFYHVECELPGDMETGMEVMERFIVSVTTELMRKHSDLIQSIAGDISHISNLLQYVRPPGTRLPVVDFDEAMNICGNDPEAWEYVVEDAPEKGKKLTRKGERAVMAQHGGAVWLTMMNHLSVPFYQAYSDGTKLKARCGDLLMGIGEMGGLGERHQTSQDVEDALLHHQVPLESYRWYMDIREYKEMQTVGWGMGMERFMLRLLGHDDVRDIALIPRLKTGRFLP